MRTDRRRLLQRLAFSESRHFSWDKDPANTMAYDMPLTTKSTFVCLHLLTLGHCSLILSLGWKNRALPAPRAPMPAGRDWRTMVEMRPCQFPGMVPTNSYCRDGEKWPFFFLTQLNNQDEPDSQCVQ